ncbi:uncharacterized protein LOC109613436 [Musca domestica]|uniref:Uncharacterized protein LOC109613436 n=1 Tax=Musca domestica TaxID=7370 RepID=A0A9J7IF30_MUSDO|nr:uncharacterized protein LOC109613436 [Musca domestica]
MSHLPVDARAILHYLNELGFRNISAEQLKEFLKDLRKLIKYEERMGVNAHQDDYYESLFRRTTASFRAKHNKENLRHGREVPLRNNSDDNLPTTSKQARQRRQKVLQEKNKSSNETSTSTDDSSLIAIGRQEHVSKPTQTASIRSTVEQIVAEILEEKFSNSQVHKHNCQKKTAAATNDFFMDPNALRAIVQDLVNKALKDKLYGPQETCPTKPLPSLIEDIVNEKLKEHLSKIKHTNDQNKTTHNLDNLSREIHEKLNLTNSENIGKPIDSQALMAELLSDSSPAKNRISSLRKQKSPVNRCHIPEWENLSGDKATTGITRLARSKPNQKLPEWQVETEGKSKTRAKSAQRSCSPVSTCGGRSSGRSRVSKTTSVLIRRSSSQGRARKPNNADPVALYQYYKNEWDYFRKHIPGETNHNRLRWHVRQRFLDPE